MQQKRQSTAAEEATYDTTSSCRPPLFPPTSKFHPDRNGLARRRRWLVVDFDGTCTEHDTTPLLPRLAAFATRKRKSSECGENGRVPSDEKEVNDVHQRDLDRRLLQFQQLEGEYFRLYEEAKREMPSSPASPEGRKGDRESLHATLDALDRPSNSVTELVSGSGVLRDLGHIDASDLGGILHLTTESAGGPKTETGVEDDANEGNGADGEELFDRVAVRLRQGCESTLARILSDECAKDRTEGSPSRCLGWSVAVLSINWCPALIDASLVQPVLKRRRDILEAESCETEVPVWSNRVDGEGEVALHVPGALAKRDRISELRGSILRDSDDGRCGGVIVYVGDSSTDLAALLEADVGILIGNSSSTTVIAEKWGIEIVPLRRRGQRGFDGAGGSGSEEMTLWRAESWQEIDDVLMELDKRWT